MESQPFISCYIPTYNRSKYLLETILSLINQSSFDIKSMEIIVCDDVSTDNTNDIVRSLQKKYTCIKYIRNKTNLWIDGNIRNAFKVCTWKYIWIMGDDDLFYPNCIHKVLDTIEAYPDAYVFHLNYDSYDKNMTECTKSYMLWKKPTAELSCLADLYAYWDYWITLITYMGVIFRNNIDSSILEKHIPETFFPHSCIWSLIHDKPMVFVWDPIIKYRTNNSDFVTAYSIQWLKKHRRIWIVGYIQFVIFCYKNKVAINYRRILKPYIFIIKWFIVLIFAFVARKMWLYNTLLHRWRRSSINIFR